MPSISDLKEQAVTDTPILVFDCTLSNGATEHWCTHGVTVGGIVYQARVLQHSAFEIQTASDQGVDGSPRISILLANADSHFSEIERACGWKGARLTVGFLFYDLRSGAPVSETAVLFQGTCNPPDEIRESTFRLTAMNRMNLQRLLLPPIRIQRRCPWQFPETLAERTEAVNGGSGGTYSRFYRCGYSPDIPGGAGNLNGSAPFTTCGYTRADCQARGMFRRFGGIGFVPPVISVRPHGKEWQPSAVSVNQARYNDFVPMVYGTAWYTPPVVFARNDGNLTRMEVLLGVGQMTEVLKVLVNDVEIPVGVSGKNMGGTGWYNIPTLGTRDGEFDLNFLDANGQPAGDPYGSMAYLVVVVPTQLNSGTSLPTVKVLVEGLQVPTYAVDGSYANTQFSANPAWILLDILRRSGWQQSELDLRSFAAAAAFCDEAIQTTDLNGNPTNISRFQCNLVLQTRRSGGDVVRGIRNASRLYLTYGAGGVLQAQVENTAALERPVKPGCSNSTQPLNGGWPAYEFGDGSTGVSGILRKSTGEPAITVFCRSTADTPNRLTAEFQDALNGYQQDSYSMVDPEDVSRAGQEITAPLTALGLPNYDQAARILKFNLDKAIHGNTYVSFDSSVRAAGIRPGDLITLTYLKEGFTRQPFRVAKISPATNYRTATITAQIHNDGWYADTNGQVPGGTGAGQQRGAGVRIPRPLIGSELDDYGESEFGIEEKAAAASDGTTDTSVLVSFSCPAVPSASGPGMPLLSLITAVESGGTLTAGQTLYYAVSGVDSAGQESALSFVVRAVITNDGSAVTLKGLSFAPNTARFNAYRGTTPANLMRIATNQPVSAQFTDDGLPQELTAPADPDFDHANFYWRLELEPEAAVTVHGPSLIGSGVLQMTANHYRGMIARITRGKGAGQERPIAANDSTTLTVAPPWLAEPDASSFFTVTEAGWRFGALAKSSPIEFTIPNRSGQVVQITGRAANVNDEECPPELSVVTRWQIGGSGVADADVPPQPSFGLGPGQRGGTLELSGLSFSDLTNTRSIAAATLTLHYWDELQGLPPTWLAAPIASDATELTLTEPGGAQPGSLIQIGPEVLIVEEVDTTGAHYQVARGAYDTQPYEYAADTPVYHLIDRVVIAPFPAEFFGSAYSGNWSYPISLPNARVAAADLFVTNSRGNSPAAGVNVTGTLENGLRTLSGGQIDLTIDGVVAVESDAVPALKLARASSVRDISATVQKAPEGEIPDGHGSTMPSELSCVVKVGGSEIATLTIAAGQTISNTINMTSNPSVEGVVIPADQPVTLDVLTVGSSYPGKRLTVTVRL